VRGWLAGHRAGVVVCDALAAGTVADRLAQVGVDAIRTGPAQMARACADLVDLVVDRRLAHRCQPAVDDALAAAHRRPLGDGWAWSRRSSSAEIAPLVALTLAAWGARTTPRPSAPFVVVAR
jgi:hypothetical protein